MHFKDCPYKIKGLERQIEEIGPNIFNLLCEWEDLEEKLGEKKSKFDTLDSKKLCYKVEGNEMMCYFISISNDCNKNSHCTINEYRNELFRKTVN